MRLSKLIEGLDAKPLGGQADIDITSICNNSANCGPGSLFVAIAGYAADGNDFIAMAIENGCAAVVATNKQKIPQRTSVPTFYAADGRKILEALSHRLYGEPSNELFMIGVTGTNGKTSTTYLIEHIFNQSKRPCGVIGNVDHHLDGQSWSSGGTTTPDAVLLQQRLRTFRDRGASACAMEVTSHSLAQKRVWNVQFDTVAFTNLTRDHLDYHKDMEEYFQSKKLLFTAVLGNSKKERKSAVINIDDAYGQRLADELPGQNPITFGRTRGDLTWQPRSEDMTSSVVELAFRNEKYELRLPMPGLHNVENALVALLSAVTAGIPMADAVRHLSSFPGIPGRMQSVANSRGLTIFVDYAHTPDGLENVLRFVSDARQRLQSRGQLVLIFGCGGDRDRGKRPEMLEVATRYADRVWITSDNARSEDQLAIIREIMAAPIGPDKYAKLRLAVNRRDAIVDALRLAGSGDIIVIAGKGHEKFEIIGNERIHFDDVEVARMASSL